MDIETLPSRTAAQRVEYFRSRLPSLGADAYWVVHPPNVRYLTGFTGEDSTLLVTGERTVLVTDSRFEEQAQGEAAVDEIMCRRKGMAATVGMLCRKLGAGKLALSASHVTHADWMALGSEFAALQIGPQKDCVVGRMRVRKDQREVESIAAALNVAEAAFGRFKQSVAPKRSEKWLAAALEWEMKVGGADEAAFKTICAVDERASLPHAACTNRQLGPTSTVLVDWGARMEGYNSDLTRVLSASTMPQQIEELAQVVLEAQQAALEKLGPGVRCGDVDCAARTVIARAGYGRYFGHAVGHGVGLEVHESPRLAAGEKEVLLPGAVVTVEPGIYLPGVGGVRIEDLALVTTTGHKVLSSLERWPSGG